MTYAEESPCSAVRQTKYQYVTTKIGRIFNHGGGNTKSIDNFERVSNAVELLRRLEGRDCLCLCSLNNGSESESVTLANQIQFSSRVQLQLVTPTCV